MRENRQKPTVIIKRSETPSSTLTSTFSMSFRNIGYFKIWPPFRGYLYFYRNHYMITPLSPAKADSMPSLQSISIRHTVGDLI